MTARYVPHQKAPKPGTLLVLLGITVFLSLQCASSSRHLARDDRIGLLVLNFKNTSVKKIAANYSPWEYGLSSMLMTDLEMTGVFNIISRERLKDVIAAQVFQYTGAVPPEKAVELGKMTAAEYLLTGSFMEMNGTLRIEAQVISIEKGCQVGAVSVTGKTDDFSLLMKELLFKITGSFQIHLSSHVSNKINRKIETRSVKASLDNFRGEMKLLQSDELKKKGITARADALLKGAMKDFKDALDSDPGYKRAQKNIQKISLSLPVSF